jgi:hypothetical protein
MESENMVQPQPREAWVAPELKKIDIEEITATGFKVGDDGDGPGSGS